MGENLYSPFEKHISDCFPNQCNIYSLPIYFILDEEAWALRFRAQALPVDDGVHTLANGHHAVRREWSTTHRQAERTEPTRCTQPQTRGTDAFLFGNRSMRLPVRTRTSACLRRDEHGTRHCKTEPWSGEMRLQPLHYIRPLLRDSTPHQPKFSASTCGMTLFKAATITSLDNHLN